MLRRIKRLGSVDGWVTLGKVTRRTGRQLARRVGKSPLARLYAETVTAVRRRKLRREVVRLWGPGPEAARPDEATLVCLMRNGGSYISSFLEHYAELGVRQIVLLDNGSDDHTLDLVRGYDYVTVLQSQLPYQSYQMLFREYLFREYGVGGWRLVVDIDELFDYPHSTELPLPQLLSYLNAHDYTAVVAYMLDMFSPGPLGSRAATDNQCLKAMYPYYDISNIRTRSYVEHYGGVNTPSNPAIKLYWGGIRGTLFNSNDWLTKHPLQFPERGARLSGNFAHDVRDARIADFTSVLYHYKLTDSFRTQVRRAVGEQNYWRGSLQYKAYQAALEAEPDLRVSEATARRLEHVDDLLDQEFLTISPAYDAWLERLRQEGQTRASPTNWRYREA